VPDISELKVCLDCGAAYIPKYSVILACPVCKRNHAEPLTNNQTIKQDR